MIPPFKESILPIVLTFKLFIVFFSNDETPSVLYNIPPLTFKAVILIFEKMLLLITAFCS